MITWAQIITVIIAVLICCATVAICDITIIKGIKKFTKILTTLVVLLRQKIEN